MLRRAGKAEFQWRYPLLAAELVARKFSDRAYDQLPTADLAQHDTDAGDDAGGGGDDDDDTRAAAASDDGYAFEWQDAPPACVRACPTGAAIRVSLEEFINYAGRSRL